MKDGKKSSEFWVVLGLIAGVVTALVPVLMRYVDQWPGVALIVSALGAAALAVTKYIGSRTDLKMAEIREVGSLAADPPKPSLGPPTFEP